MYIYIYYICQAAIFKKCNPFSYPLWVSWVHGLVRLRDLVLDSSEYLNSNTHLQVLPPASKYLNRTMQFTENKY